MRYFVVATVNKTDGARDTPKYTASNLSEVGEWFFTLVRHAETNVVSFAIYITPEKLQ